MRKLMVHALLGVAVVSSIATSEDTPPTPPPTPTSGPWQSSDGTGSDFTLAPDEVMVLTFTVDVDAASVPTVEESTFTVYLTPSEQQANAGAQATMSFGSSFDDAFVSTSDVTLELDDFHLDCVNVFSYCRSTFTVEIEQVQGGRLDIDAYGEANIYGDGGVEGPVSVSVTQVSQ